MIDNTNEPVNEPADEVKNPAALLAKNRELLAKLKSVQEELATAQTALASEAERHGDTSAKLRQFRLEDPFKSVMNGLSPNPGLMAKVLGDYMTVDLDKDGMPIVLNKDGEPLTWTRTDRNHAETVAVELTVDSLHNWIRDGLGNGPDSPYQLLPKAQGTGAPGGHGGVYQRAAPKPPASPGQAAPAPAFGLR